MKVLCCWCKLYRACILVRLEGVQTIEELNDVYSHFLLYYANDLVTIRNKTKDSLKQQDQSQDLEVTVEVGGPKEKAMMKHAKRRDFYTICQENGLGALVSKFGLKPEHFGDNLRDGYQRHETEQQGVLSIINSIYAHLQGPVADVRFRSHTAN